MDHPYVFRVASLGPSRPLPGGVFVRAFSAFEAWQALARAFDVEPSEVAVALHREPLPEGAKVIDVRPGSGPIGDRCSSLVIKKGQLAPEGREKTPRPRPGRGR